MSDSHSRATSSSRRLSRWRSCSMEWTSTWGSDPALTADLAGKGGGGRGLGRGAEEVPSNRSPQGVVAQVAFRVLNGGRGGAGQMRRPAGGAVRPKPTGLAKLLKVL